MGTLFFGVLLPGASAMHLRYNPRAFLPRMSYGTIIPGLTVNGSPAPYPVVNEREIRASAGLMFAVGISVMWYIRGTGDYVPMYYVVPMFWLEFFLKTVFSPRTSIFGFLTAWMVQRQRPEYVGAIQKRFAWGLGLLMATAMMIVAVFLGIRGWAPFLICMTCLVFMWMESALGICVGCKIYSWLLQKGWLPEPEHRPACPGGVCSIRKRSDEKL